MSKTIEIDGERFELVPFHPTSHKESGLANIPPLYALKPPEPQEPEPQWSQYKEYKAWGLLKQFFPDDDKGLSELIKKLEALYAPDLADELRGVPKASPATPDEPEWEVVTDGGETESHMTISLNVGFETAEVVQEAIEALMEAIYGGVNGGIHILDYANKARTLIQKGKDE